MRNRQWIWGLLAILAVMGSAAGQPLKVILDTDIGPDVDDAGAVAVLHAFADNGEVQILAMMVSSTGHSGTWGPPCLDAINTYYGRPQIPIGVSASGPARDSRYNQQVAEGFPQDLGTGNAWDATELYRKVLSEQDDGSVVIISVGFLSNLEDLLKSAPDSISSLDGTSLVAQKVNRWVCMGGAFPSGIEFNFIQDATATGYAVANWPTPVHFSGVEIGRTIMTGSGLAGAPASNPVRFAYQLYNGLNDRSSWDQTALLAAVRDPRTFWKVETSGSCAINPNGSNAWQVSPDADHEYLIGKEPDTEMAAMLEALMLLPPAALGTGPQTSRGTPHAWLEAHGLVSGGDHEAADVLDADGDGKKAWEEFKAGTFPTMSASVLKATRFNMPGPGEVTLTWNSVAGKMYGVQGKNSPGTGFTNILSGVCASGSETVKTFPAGTGPWRQFRVVVDGLDEGAEFPFFKEAVEEDSPVLFRESIE